VGVVGARSLPGFRPGRLDGPVERNHQQRVRGGAPGAGRRIRSPRSPGRGAGIGAARRPDEAALTPLGPAGAAQERAGARSGLGRAIEADDGGDVRRTDHDRHAGPPAARQWGGDRRRGRHAGARAVRHARALWRLGWPAAPRRRGHDGARHGQHRRRARRDRARHRERQLDGAAGEARASSRVGARSRRRAASSPTACRPRSTRCAAMLPTATSW
jgi:hypothetical protein